MVAWMTRPVLLLFAALACLPAASSSLPAQASLPEPDDPAYHELQWAPHELGALEAWNRYPSRYFSGGDRPQDAPLVALIDTGVDAAHPDFLNTGATGAAVSQGGQLALSLARTFLLGSAQDGSSDVTDEHGQGTHLAGLIAGAANNGQGIAGLGYPVRLLPLKVAGDDGSATHDDLARAIVYAADAGCSVILTAFSGPTWSQTLQDAVDYAWDRGCFIVAPAGDGMGDLASFPAACPQVFGVGALTAAGSVAAYSSTGSYVALAAPGGDETAGIYSCLPTVACTLRQDGASPVYGWLYGTAQAAAHVAAAAGLYAGSRSSSPATGDEGRALWQALQRSASAPDGAVKGQWVSGLGRGRLALEPLLAEEQGSGPGGIVGRVLVEGAPVAGALVRVCTVTGEEKMVAFSEYPAGAYRVPNLPAGGYVVTAEAGGRVGQWERLTVSPGCDEPGVDFRLGDPAAGAELVSAQLPGAAVRGSSMQVSLTLRNVGDSTWRRMDGYRLKQTVGGSPSSVPIGLGPGEEVRPGESRTFAFSAPVPDICGFLDMSWQMCQEGGQGRFGQVAAARVSVTSFLDVPADHWAVDEIEAAKAAHLLKGYADSTYHPERSVTRDQMAVYLARALAGGDEAVPDGPSQPTFSDVPASHWAFRQIEYAHSRDVVEGYPEGLYCPEQVVDRGQMAPFVARAMAGGETALAAYSPPETPSFPDVQPDAWMYPHLEYIKQRKVVSGYEDGLYHPEGICTRDQMAVYLVRAFLR